MSLVVVFAVVAIVIIGLMIYGLISNNKHENSWLEKFIVKDPWVPLTLVTSTELDRHYPVKPAIQWAIEFWNREVGIKLFNDLGDLTAQGRTVPIMLETERYVKDGVSTEQGLTAAYTVLHHQQDGTVADVAIYIVVQASLTSELFKRALAHELGHCLGLDHDDQRDSIMFGSLAPGTFRVSELDREMLKARYVGASR